MPKKTYEKRILTNFLKEKKPKNIHSKNTFFSFVETNFLLENFFEFSIFLEKKLLKKNSLLKDFSLYFQ